MQITNHTTDDAVLEELGARLRRHRLDLDLTQGQLAEEAGVSKRTIERIEAGQSAQVSKLLRILRAMALLENLEVLVPAPTVSPMALLQLAARQRRRASGRTDRAQPETTFTWGEDT